MSSRKVYSREFKVEAIALAKRSGKRINQIEEELGIAQGLLSKWKRQARSEAPTAFPGNGRLPEDEEEIRRLKRELERVTAERDLLKNIPCRVRHSTSRET
jgi:transposase